MAKKYLTKFSFVELLLFICGAGLIGGVGHAIFNPEPTVLLGIAYAVYWGIGAGGGIYAITYYQNKKAK